METEIKTNPYIVVGGGKGLGRFLANRLGCRSLTRGDSTSAIRNTDIVIFAARSEWSMDSITDFKKSFNDNFNLLHEVLTQNPFKMIYLSSIDVYQKTFPCESLDKFSLYPVFKVLSEELVERSGIPHLILRPGLLINDIAPLENSTTLTDIVLKIERESLSLDERSTFFPVTYSYFLEVLDFCMSNNVKGTLDVVTRTPITLKQVASSVQFHPQFGDYVYQSSSSSDTKSWRLTESLNIDGPEMLEGIVGNFTSNV